MLNGTTPNNQNHKTQSPCNLSNIENSADQHEIRAFSLKEIFPENPYGPIVISPIIKFKPLLRSEENSTNHSNLCNRKITDELKSSVGTSITEFRLAEINSPERQRNLNAYIGFSPCAVYCGCCNRYVQSRTEYLEDRIGYFKKLTQAFSLCCGSAECYKKSILHKCPYCNLILAKYSPNIT